MATRRKPLPISSPVLLGVEGGATRSTILAVSPDREVLASFELGPANSKLLSDRELLWYFRSVAEKLGPLFHQVSAACFGLAGTRTDAEKARLVRTAQRLWPKVPCVGTDDLRTALLAAPEVKNAAARILILSGTGSCIYGETDSGQTAKIGGRGHVIGDRASACDIGQRALKALMASYDHSRRWPKLGRYVLDALCLNEPDDLIAWSIEAGKKEIASVAEAVFYAASRRDPIAQDLLSQAAVMLVEDGLACADRLSERRATVQFVLNGSVLLKNSAFLRQVRQGLEKAWPKAVVTPLTQASTWGAVALAEEAWQASQQPIIVTKKAPAATGLNQLVPPLSSLIGSPTEARNPRSKALDTMPLAEAVELMLSEDRKIPQALLKEEESLVWLIEKVITAFKTGGHLFYLGAGTSGRLGVLDASECPPTFRAPREQVQGIIAGGQQALWSAVEGAEDDVAAGANAIKHRHVAKYDVVIGIAASGRTPFVWGGLSEAKKRGATTALIAFNPKVKSAATPGLADRILAPDLGPEILTGSTRLKSGTATKLMLNIITTLAMSRVGKVMSNLMIDLNPSNVKLRDRAIRIVCEITECPKETAKSALEQSGWIVKAAVEALRRK